MKLEFDKDELDNFSSYLAIISLLNLNSQIFFYSFSMLISEVPYIKIDS